MGSPGFALLCEKGHLYRWIEEHLVWDDQMEEDFELAKEEGCPCGAKLAECLGHYGSIGDCICLDDELNYPKPIHEDKILVKIPECVTKAGKPIDAYHDVRYDVYDIENIRRLIKKDEEETNRKP